MYGEKDISDYRYFWCRALVNQDKQRREKGKQRPRAKEAIDVGFVPSMSVSAFWNRDPGRKENSGIEQSSMSMNSATGKGGRWSNISSLSDNFTDILLQQTCDVLWVPYNKLHVSNYRKAHHDNRSNAVVLMVESQKSTYTRAIWSRYLDYSNELLRIRDKENNPIHADFAGVT